MGRKCQESGDESNSPSSSNLDPGSSESQRASKTKEEGNTSPPSCHHGDKDLISMSASCNARVIEAEELRLSIS